MHCNSWKSDCLSLQVLALKFVLLFLAMFVTENDYGHQNRYFSILAWPLQCILMVLGLIGSSYQAPIEWAELGSTPYNQGKHVFADPVVWGDVSTLPLALALKLQR